VILGLTIVNYYSQWVLRILVIIFIICGRLSNFINFISGCCREISGENHIIFIVNFVIKPPALITKILNNKSTYGEIYNVSEGDYKYSEILDTITEVFEQKVIKIKVPERLINLYKRLPFILPVFNKLETLSTITTVDNSKMLKELDFKSEYSFKEGM